MSLEDAAPDTPAPNLEPSRRRVTPSRRTESLAKIELFRSLSPQAIAALDTQCTWRKYSRNQWVVEYHEISTDVLFVLSGVVRLKIPASSGREVLFKDLNAGGFVGEIAAIDGKPSVTGILAYTDVVIARMPRGVFRAVLDDHPDVRDQVLLRAAKIIHTLTNRVREFSTLDVKYRIYAELLRLSQPRPDAKDQAVISPPPVQAAIAARVSTRREAVAREMKALERAGLIERKRGALVLNDTKRLQCMIKRVAESDGADFDAYFLD